MYILHFVKMIAMKIQNQFPKHVIIHHQYQLGQMPFPCSSTNEMGRKMLLISFL